MHDMNPVLLVLWFLIRAAVIGVLTYCEAKGWVPKVTADAATNQIVGWIFVGVITLGLAIHAYWQKWRQGLLKYSPFPPINLPHLALPTKTINDMAKARTLNPDAVVTPQNP